MHGLGAVDFRIPLAPKYYGYSILAQSYEFFPHLAQLYNLDFTLSCILQVQTFAVQCFRLIIIAVQYDHRVLIFGSI